MHQRTQFSRAILTKNNKVLLLEMAGESPRYILPGGHVESDETPDDALLREVLEETSISVISFIKLGVFPKPKKLEDVHVYFVDKYVGEVQLNEESMGYVWVDMTSEQELQKYDIRPLHLDYLRLAIDKLQVGVSDA